jgi:transposase
MRKSRLSWATQSVLIGLFIEGTSIRRAADAAQVNKNTANTFFNRLRQLIYLKSPDAGFIEAEINLDGEFLQTALARGKSEKDIRPFGLVFNDRKIHVALAAKRRPGERELIFRERRVPDYLFLFNPKIENHCAGIKKADNRNYYRIQSCEHHHCPMKQEFGDNNFCNYFAEQHKKHFGIPDTHFHLYLKEFEWKFNNPDTRLQRLQLEEWAVNELA